MSQGHRPRNTSRFTDNPFRDPNIDPETAKRLDARNAVYNYWHETGDPGPAREFGSDLPDRQESKECRNLDYKPLTNQGDNSLNLQGALVDFQSIALAFHTEFFNTRFEDGLKGYDSPTAEQEPLRTMGHGEILGHILTQENM